jgi:DNA repair protein RecO (recombination protein O)
VATVVPGFVVKLLSVSGYHPSLTACAGCGAAEGLCGFSPALGGSVCAACAEEDQESMRLLPEHLALMARLLAGDFGIRADPHLTADVTQVLRRYAEYHLERPLRSLALLA